MNIGVLSERRDTENRVSLTPSGAGSLARAGHKIIVQSGAGSRARFGDEEYRAEGARVVYGRDEVLGRSDLLLRVSAIDRDEAALLREGQTVLAFHHLAAADRSLVNILLDSGVTLIGYEVIEDVFGDLPVLHALSEIAGQLAVHVAAHYLETIEGGRGILLGGSTGIPPANVVILGAGVVGLSAARTAAGNRAQVMLIDTEPSALRRAEQTLGRSVITEISHVRAIERAVSFADALIGAILIRGERTPHLITRPMVASMKPGSVIVDVSIDQGGSVESSRPTTLADPVFIESGVTHYAVPNMTSAVGRTASVALSYASVPFIRALAGSGIDAALCERPGLAAGVYTYRGRLVSEGVGRAFGMESERLGDLLGRNAATPGCPLLQEDTWRA